MKKKRLINLILCILLFAIIFFFYNSYNKCKIYADNYKNYDCITKCNIKSLIKREYECMSEPCLNCDNLWKEVKSVEVIEYENCLKEREECYEKQKQWLDQACMRCLTPQERAELKRLLENEASKNNEESQIVNIQVIEEWTDENEHEILSTYDDFLEDQKKEDCLIYFDWCNTYYENGDQTKKICLEYEESKCLKYKDNTWEQEGVIVYPPLWSEYWYREYWNCKCNGDLCFCEN